ncbi:MAG: hypothetical protein J5956_11360 [Ruminococcus sp.]|nr:hypothetical protein [Ruminococcus sp.]
MKELENSIKDLELQLGKAESVLSGIKYHPEIKGTLVMKYVKCGRPSCECQQGKLHGKYAYIKTKDEEGRQIFKYIKGKDKETLIPLYEENKRYKKALASVNKLKKALSHYKNLLRKEKKNQNGKKGQTCGQAQKD